MHQRREAPGQIASIALELAPNHPMETSKEDPLERFQLIERLGEGSYGEVYSAIDKITKQVVAIKVIPVEAEIDEFMKEIQILQRCKSQYVVQYIGSYLKDGDLWIVMEHCVGGSVSDLMTICEVTPTEEQIRYLIAGTALGLRYLHSQRLIHRDLKSGNVLLTRDGGIKLADFGVSAQLSSTMSRRRTVIGTPFWMAPEVIQESQYDYRADIWSLGVTTIELADGEPPFADIHPMRAIFMIPSKPPSTVRDPSAWSHEFNDFVATCMKSDAQERPSSQEILNHPFIADAAKEIEENHGCSKVVTEWLQECLPLIEQARREDAEYYAENEENSDTEQEASNTGTVRYRNGTMIVNGTLVKAGSATAEATDAAIKQGTLRKHDISLMKDKSDQITSAAEDLPERKDIQENSGTYVYHKGPVEEDDEVEERPAFMQHFLNNQSNSVGASTEGKTENSVSENTTVQRPITSAKSVYTIDRNSLENLSLDELEDRLNDLDAQFRQDMSQLTRSYDESRTAIEDVIVAKGG